MRTHVTATLALAALLTTGALAPPATATAPAGHTTSAANIVPTASTTRVTTAKKKHRLIEKYVLVRVNKARARAGLKKLERSTTIVKVARRWSATQARRGELAHNPSYASQIPRGWTRASENVAWTSATGTPKKLAKRIVRLWLRSSGHRANILGTHYTTTGIGVARSRHGWYFTQNFSD